jgi:hypothetical protein
MTDLLFGLLIGFFGVDVAVEVAATEIDVLATTTVVEGCCVETVLADWEVVATSVNGDRESHSSVENIAQVPTNKTSIKIPGKTIRMHFHYRIPEY